MSEDTDIRTEFRRVVNMTPKALRAWLDSDESTSVGQQDGGGESTGHESGRRIVAGLDLELAPGTITVVVGAVSASDTLDES